jgi:hypothetical protein
VSRTEHRAGQPEWAVTADREPRGKCVPAGPGAIHPRACGEHRLRRTAARRALGPSPRVRGARAGGAGGVALVGTIPARAGSTGRGDTTTPVLGDHPRACGEHRTQQGRFPWCRGPSPRVRGARAAAPAPQPAAGTIPARAGSTGRCAEGAPSCGDHPRACGEHSWHIAPADVDLGPSPRVRGAPPPSGQPAQGLGTIPARAGSTGGRRLWPHLAGDHPRACGEHLETPIPTSFLMGPSPRVRGALVPIGHKEDE